MRVALVHDDLVQWGGAEKMLVALSEIFPDAPIFTSLYDQNHKFLKEHFSGKKIFTSFMQKIPGWRYLYKILLPLYPLAFEQFDFSGYDVVISQTTRFAKSIITKPETKHICYCHTPPRFLWGFSEEKMPGVLRILGYLSFLRNYDRVASHRVDSWIAGSENAASRIKQVYGSESKVIYPFVDLSRFQNVETFDGGYLLTISRLNAYKRVDLAIEAANRLKVPLKIVGVGPEEEGLKARAAENVDFLGNLDEKLLTLVLAGCRALIIGGEEDFGLTSLEAQALGKPVIAYGKGGALETVIDGESGYFFKSPTVDSLVSTLQIFEKNGYNEKACRAQAQKFSQKIFEQQFRSLASSL